MTSKKTPSSTNKQTSIASYFATTRGGPLSVAQLDQVVGGVVSDTVEKFRKIEKGEVIQGPEYRDTPGPSGENSSNQSGKEVKKTTFSGGSAKVSSRIKQLQESGKILCVMGSGRCGTHNVKLIKSVKSKKISCVEPGGGIGWKYVDVTCLVCPKKVDACVGLNMAKDQQVGNAKKKRKVLQGEAMNLNNQSEYS